MPFKPGHENVSTGGVSKIGHLPLDIRTEINRRLDDGHSPKKIAAWLNTREEVRKALDEKWPGLPVYETNIRLWRQGGYQQWVRKREKLENLRDLSDYALKLGQAAGGSIADGGAAIAGGRIMEALETASDEDMLKMVRAICELRSGDISRARLEQNDRKIAQANEKIELERKRFQRQTAELFLTWYEDKRARAIVESRDGNAEKIELLGRAMFGEDW